ncbi:helix-turn-helix transcriptional regulator [Sulfitobacter pseudonitzschiae]|uniref:Helix-turn-helix transcriptional regulator n=1 Tax=Pseudosulfitobacter pseudonitzschiae TaxID=1402135 RepID=A0A9Q2RYN6_9RHOB|nr:XRE family transcriptional regulator [Pseudosulfitobacter pseudonitzschiae]MBM2293809.1 helix-turn-helix transcriptional regulator [Pseudosulfitobacter pseudonitzschiae]MBM2298726.1 helix-turn-helix transcriptional regulator [Pseudosulfitobacter pseudonitzschiae]MBM2303641.1 helix-turn-helix transcriptional regulator [Pseudosulfitobacter pseudonitzschiae]MBM2313423.1 helix-turn-helix transcriptional regulator [Pseudosulfitobacter pseudonitzschiae]MBM2318337.1 helix-turn-helix transcriptiona
MDVINATWIKARLTGERGEQARLAEAMGIDNDKMSRILKGKRRVQPEEIPKVLKYFNVDTELDNAQKSMTQVDSPTADANQSLIPVYDVAASAGHGMIPEYEAQTHSLAFPPDYLRKLTSSNPQNLAIFSVKGDSMEPTLLDDDVVMLDTSKVSLSFDGLFVLRFDDALHVKRVGRSSKKGHVTILSDNASIYPPLEILARDVQPVGKVLWYGRKV